ncbi:MAG: NADH-quinone oxidoreductase subunit A [Myxococcales bacterium]|nr:NADH-quinone oxidoreductase subunit A [Myxococcales bacterium]
MLDQYIPLFITLVLALGLGGTILGLSLFFGPRRPTPVKQEIFECGNEASGNARERFNVKFYLVAILFLVFDIEAVFVYPWALVFSESIGNNSDFSPLLVFGEMMVFIGVILVGLVYCWRKGALDWNR